MKDLPSGEQAALHWIESMVGMKLEGGVLDCLKSGEVLCDLVNAIKPGLVSRVIRLEI